MGKKLYVGNLAYGVTMAICSRCSGLTAPCNRPR